jgi:hypothetical protein
MSSPDRQASPRFKIVAVLLGLTSNLDGQTEPQQPRITWRQ